MVRSVKSSSRHDAPWFEAGGSKRLDVYDVRAGVLATVRARLEPLAGRARLIERDLNFAALPPAAHDCICSSGVLHWLINLEHVFSQVDRALRPGGLFAFTAYLGEARCSTRPLAATFFRWPAPASTSSTRP